MPYTDIVDVDVPADRVAGAGATAAQDLIQVTAKQREVLRRANLLGQDLTTVTQQVANLPAPFAGSYQDLTGKPDLAQFATTTSLTTQIAAAKDLGQATGNLDPAKISQNATYRLVSDVLMASWTAKATTQDINTAISQLRGTAPAALDTLAEIAAQLAADETGTAAILATQNQHTTQIGPLTGLLTAAKTSLVAAVNELFTSLGAKAPLNAPVFTGNVGGISKGMVGLSSVDNTSDTAKPVSTAQATAISTATTALVDNAPTTANTLGKLYVALFGSLTSTKLLDSLLPMETSETLASAGSLAFTKAAVILSSTGTITALVGTPTQVRLQPAAGITTTCTTPGAAAITANGQLLLPDTLVLDGSKREEASFRRDTLTNANGTFSVYKQVQAETYL